MDESRTAILVVEDEPLLRLAAVDMVEEAGFEALQAAEGEEAVRILEQRCDVRIVFTDIDMPRGMDGVSLATHIWRRWPPIAVLFTSGHKAPDFELPAHSAFFPKPYREAEVVAAFRELAG